MSVSKLDIIEKIKKRESDKESIESYQENELDYIPSIMLDVPGSSNLHLSPSVEKLNRRYRGPMESEKENIAKEQIERDLSSLEVCIESLVEEFYAINKSSHNRDIMRYIKKISHLGNSILQVEEKAKVLSERMDQIEKN